MNWYSEEAALWHAFDTLDEQRNGVVPKSKLKVLAHNLAGVYNKNGIDLLLEEDYYGKDLTYNDFKIFLKEVLSKPSQVAVTEENHISIDISKKSSPAVARKSTPSVHPCQFNDVCWMLCSKFYISHESDDIKFDIKVIQKLWEIFCFLCERDDSENLIIPVCIDIEEADYVCRKFCDITGQTGAVVEKPLLNENSMNFSSFLLSFSMNCIKNLSQRDIEQSVNDLYEFFIKDCLKKGILLKKGNAKPVILWKERLFILSTKCLEYYKLGVRKELKGRITIESEHSAEGVPDKPGMKPQRLTYTTKNRVFEMSANDLKNKNEWIFLLKAAIENCGKDSYQHEACKQRRLKRNEHRRELQLKIENELRENERIQQTISEIEAEKEARGEALRKLQEEAAIRESEQKRLQQLAEEKRRELERERLSRLEAESRMQEEAEKQLKDLQEKMSQDIELEKQTRQENELRIQAEAEERMKSLESKMAEDILLEKKAREDAENKLSMEESLRVAEEERVRELQELTAMLEKHLDDEKLARKDEEIVRRLQASLLEEEQAKRAELEELQKNLSHMYTSEKERSEILDQERITQETLLEQAIEQQQRLEQERKEAESKAEEAMKKLQDAENKRVVLEKRIKTREKPVGLARPIEVEARPLITHRGEGAFVEADFVKYL